MPTNRHEVSARSGGSVLLLALWALLFLGMVAVSVSSYVSMHMDAAWSLADRSVCRHAAKAGVEAAIGEVCRGTNAWAALDQSWGEPGSALDKVGVGDGVFTVFHVEPGEGGSIVTNCGLADEERKININAITNNAACRDVVRALFETAGGVDSVTAENITACIADWIDGDDQSREGGAENGDYALRNPPYRCRNGRIGRIEELLLVNGVETNILAGVAGYLTVYGTNGSVNVNTASPAVLRALANARKGTQTSDAEALVARILEFRKAGKTVEDLDKRKIREALFGTGELTSAEQGEWGVLEWLLNHRLIAVQSRHFCGISAGQLLRGGSGEARIMFVYDGVTGNIERWDEY